jgi:hypothetical protein
MDKIRTLNLRNQISNAHGQILTARKSGSVLLYDKALEAYQRLLLDEFLEITQRENNLIRVQLEENQKMINEQFKYKNCLKVVR